MNRSYFHVQASNPVFIWNTRQYRLPGLLCILGFSNGSLVGIYRFIKIPSIVQSLSSVLELHGSIPPSLRRNRVCRVVCTALCTPQVARQNVEWTGGFECLGRVDRLPRVKKNLSALL